MDFKYLEISWEKYVKLMDAIYVGIYFTLAFFTAKMNFI